MSENHPSSQFRGVVCLHCSQPFRVPVRHAVENPSQTGAPATGETEPAGRSVFLAWCPHCHHEAPYEASAVRQFSAAPSLADTPANQSPARAAGAAS